MKKNLVVKTEVWVGLHHGGSSKVKRSPVCFGYVLSPLFTSFYKYLWLLSGGRWSFLCRRSSLSRLVMNKCVFGQVRSRSLLSAPLSCCLLPRCPARSPPPSHHTQPLDSLSSQEETLVGGGWRGSGSSSDQPAATARRRSYAFTGVLILCFWLAGDAVYRRGGGVHDCRDTIRRGV